MVPLVKRLPCKHEDMRTPEPHMILSGVVCVYNPRDSDMEGRGWQISGASTHFKTFILNYVCACGVGSSM